MRRKQADLRFKEATELGAPARLKGPPPPTRAPILEKLDTDGNTESVKDLQGRTDLVHDHFQELFADPMHRDFRGYERLRSSSASAHRAQRIIW